MTRRRTRFCAACLAIAALLFAPFAVSAHACPYMGDAAAMQAMSGGGAPDTAPPCAHHCSEGAASADLAKLPPSPSPAPVPVLRIVLPEPALAGPPIFPSGDFLADPSPPLTRFTVLRI